MDSNHSPFIKSLSTRVGTDSHRDIETVNLNPSALVLSAMAKWLARLLLALLTWLRLSSVVVSSSPGGFRERFHFSMDALIGFKFFWGVDLAERVLDYQG